MATHLIGDLHGHYRDFVRLLQESNLADDSLQWTGGTDTLWLMGDFFDRGASGVKCVELCMSLQKQAAAVGGSVNSLLGNHELMILAAHKFRDAMTPSGISVTDLWLRWGGIESDLADLTDEQAAWIAELPAMVLTEDSLLVHADAMLYVDHGITIDAVNKSFAALIQNDDLDAWMPVLSAFGEHMAFLSLSITGGKRARQLLALYGGKQLVHGHTPIPFARQMEPTEVTEAWRYADDVCLNVDGGMYMGSPGFVHTL